ncbi:MAG: hypothetical protein IPP83_08830 [Flavobacteriales bacterium]|nr:hypothetical protein [Flavobacteriales bacterium]
MRRPLILFLAFVVLGTTVRGQLIEAKHLVTSLGGGAGQLTISQGPDSLRTALEACSSVAFAFEVAVNQKLSVGIHYDRIGTDRVDNSVESIRFTTYLIGLTYRPMNHERAALETQIAIGPCIMSLLSTGSNLPLKGRSGTIAVGVRYLRSFSGTMGAFAGVEHTGGASVTVTDYDGKTIEDASGIPLKLDWNSTRFRVGLFTRF